MELASNWISTKFNSSTRWLFLRSVDWTWFLNFLLRAFTKSAGSTEFFAAKDLKSRLINFDKRDTYYKRTSAS